MHKLSTADELAEIRVAMARLRKREAVLCAHIDAQPILLAQRLGWPILWDMRHIPVHA